MQCLEQSVLSGWWYHYHVTPPIHSPPLLLWTVNTDTQTKTKPEHVGRLTLSSTSQTVPRRWHLRGVCSPELTNSPSGHPSLSVLKIAKPPNNHSSTAETVAIGDIAAVIGTLSPTSTVRRGWQPVRRCHKQFRDSLSHLHSPDSPAASRSVSEHNTFINLSCGKELL